MNVYVVIVYLLICLIWGSTWLAIKIGLESMPPVLAGGLRFITAAAVIYLVMQVKRFKIDTGKEALKLYGYMIFLSYAIPFALVYWGEKYVASGLASVLFGVYPFFVAIISYFSLKNEELGFYKIAGLFLGFAGIVIIFWNSFGSTADMNFWGMAAIVLSAFLQSFIAVKVKKHGGKLNPLSMNLLPMFASGIIMLVFSLMVEDFSKLNFSNEAILSILYLAVFGSVVTFTSYYWLIKKISIIVLSLIAFITPVIALILGVVFYNEDLLPNHIAGSAFVLTGLLVANFSSIRQYKK